MGWSVGGWVGRWAWDSVARRMIGGGGSWVHCWCVVQASHVIMLCTLSCAPCGRFPLLFASSCYSSLWFSRSCVARVSRFVTGTPKPETLNLKPQTSNPKFQTLNPEQVRDWLPDASRGRPT